MAYDVSEYRRALKLLKMNIQELDNMMDGLQFEHGEGGISSRAENYANNMDEELRQAWDNLATVQALIKEHA